MGAMDLIMSAMLPFFPGVLCFVAPKIDLAVKEGVFEVEGSCWVVWV